MDTLAVVLEEPERIALSRLNLVSSGDEDIVVDVEWSGISTGTERLLWSGRMPPFPGMGYPLVPGYESVGRVAFAGSLSGRRAGERVFVPGASCFGPVRGLFGGTASRLVVPGHRATPVGEELEDRGVLLALAGTAYHAIVVAERTPDLIIGHGVLGRLLARLTVALGGKPAVWEQNRDRIAGADGYVVTTASDDERRDYKTIIDVSGDSTILDTLVSRLAPRGEIILAGFYPKPIEFTFPPAFMKEAKIRVSAEWQPSDLEHAKALIDSGALSLNGLITHRRPALEAASAYRTAFEDPSCLKMVLDWRACG